MMKKILLSILAFAFVTISLNAQNNVQLTINHLLGEEAFNLNQGAQNNAGHDFNVTRLEYYISGVSLMHDGGQETIIEDTWILVNANEPIQYDLGDREITSIESIKLHIGVEEEYNHADPSTYASGHALAPVWPSMHWGWTSGYRFVAMEGNGGVNYDYLYQLHGLGDANYFMTEIPLTTTAMEGVIHISLDADYEKALENIAVEWGVIEHGTTDEARTILENFRDHVFTEGAMIIGVDDIDHSLSFDLYPNPVSDGRVTVNFDSKTEDKYRAVVTNILGKQIQTIDQITTGQTIDLVGHTSGIYFINLMVQNKIVASKKVVLK